MKSLAFQMFLTVLPAARAYVASKVKSDPTRLDLLDVFDSLEHALRQLIASGQL